MFSIASQDRSSAAVSVRAAAAPVVDLENSAGLSQNLKRRALFSRHRPILPGLSPAQIVALATREGSRPRLTRAPPSTRPSTDARRRPRCARTPPRALARGAASRGGAVATRPPRATAAGAPAAGARLLLLPGALVSRLVSRRARTIPRVPRSRRTPARFTTTPSPPRARDSRTSRTRTSSAPRSPRCARWTSARTSAGSA